MSQLDRDLQSVVSVAIMLLAISAVLTLWLVAEGLSMALALFW